MEVLLRNLHARVQMLRRGSLLHVPVAGVVGTQMKGNLRIDPGEVLRNRADLLIAVVLAGNDQRCNLHMAALVGDLDCPQHLLESRFELLPVELLLKSLEVDVCSVHRREDVLRRILVEITCRYEDVLQSGRLDEPGGFQHVLRVNGRLVVGIGNADRFVFPGAPGELLGAYVLRVRPSGL